MLPVTTPLIVDYGGVPRAVLRVVDDFGFRSYDLAAPPRRLLGADDPTPALESNIDARRVVPLDTIGTLLTGIPAGESWLTVSSRTIARLCAAYLVAEDPQHRLDAHKAATLMHQVSLVQHILTHPNLRRVLVADEVGLGKTIEAGLIIRRLVDERPGLRVLYLAPARLVSNVAWELREKLDLDARRWIAGMQADARLESDRIVVASIHKAVFGQNLDQVLRSGPWDVLVVDECHHLSDWDPSGGKPNQGFRLVSRLAAQLPADGRLILMSGTPHQGSEARFTNILRLLSDDPKAIQGAAGRVIFRTKDRVRDWYGKPLFPGRDIRPPTVVPLGPDYDRWYVAVGSLYDRTGGTASQIRAVGWAKGQALQWAASSVQAGLGYLVRLGIRRLGWDLGNNALAAALGKLRPYRGGSRSESVEALYARLRAQIGGSLPDETPDEDGEEVQDDQWRPDPEALAALLDQGVALLRSAAATAKWLALARLIDAADGEKIVLFAQPVETVTVVAEFLRERYQQSPAIIIGNQSEAERHAQVDAFQSDHGPRFLVSSRAGGEGLNMQRARRLVHLDVPWNPMELEQRIGRIHRFGSRRTVIIHTVVAAGSREIDMYRIAREKLKMIATQLDPEDFETLFGRVMSLVPPKELEEILGSIETGSATNAASAEIGRLVTEGYRSWKSFDSTYRGQADQIRSINPGEAVWGDVGQFLTRFGKASASDNVGFTGFEFRQEEIVAVEGRLPAIVINDRLYVCGDTGGMRAESSDGRPVEQLGLNVPEVANLLSSWFVSDQPAGVAHLKRPDGLEFLGSTTEPVGIIAMLRQSMQQELGRSTEQLVTLHIGVVRPGGAVALLEPEQRAAVVRACLSATRVKDPSLDVLSEDSRHALATMALDLRRPSSDDVTRSIRHAVWPVAAIFMK